MGPPPNREHRGAKGRKPGGASSNQMNAGHHAKWLMRELIKKHGGQCTHCGKFVTRKRSDPCFGVSVHIDPLKEMGRDELPNMTLRCYACREQPSPTATEAPPPVS